MSDDDEHLDPPEEATAVHRNAGPRFRWGAASHPGHVRPGNEDSFVASGSLFGVADGMGGHQAGEVASALAADMLHARLGEGAPSLDEIIAAVTDANAAIFQSARDHVDQRGMGPTLTALATLRNGDDGGGERLVLLNVGDSRTYLLRHGELHRLTVDHSYVQQLIATGHISEHEARTHPRRNIVTRALGIEPTVHVDTWLLPVVRADRYVLCSDGLVDEVSDIEIERIAIAVSDPQRAADELVAMANRHGGRDNVTVVVVDVLRGAAPPAPTTDMSTVAIPVNVSAGVDPAAWGDDTPAPADDDGSLPPRVAIDGSAVAQGRTRSSRRAKRLALVAGALVAVLLVVLIIVLVAGGGDDDQPTDTLVTSTTAANTTTTRSTSSTVPSETTEVATTLDTLPSLDPPAGAVA